MSLRHFQLIVERLDHFPLTDSMALRLVGEEGLAIIWEQVAVGIAERHVPIPGLVVPCDRQGRLRPAVSLAQYRQASSRGHYLMAKRDGVEETCRPCFELLENKDPTSLEPEAPVTGLSFAEARAMTVALGGRLPWEHEVALLVQHFPELAEQGSRVWTQSPFHLLSAALCLYDRERQALVMPKHPALRQPAGASECTVFDLRQGAIQARFGMHPDAREPDMQAWVVFDAQPL